MATQATIGKWKVQHNAADLEEVLSFSGLGKTNSQVDVTNFDSDPGTREYIAGLADGSEVTIACNYIPDATVQLALIADVDAGASNSFTVTYGGSTRTYAFTAVCLGYTITPSIDSQNQIEFTVKISGDITAT